eukprot:CAMPEP_0177656710 /NCGR_PEP_ID=MMETSP0447-20121125/15740_1 /TAXON_ID=0 /ORGANISM="Stygamoeba regulata, Strain BSH-02190019" /LENGTH=738 /DNA_ID=CAMNT_0019160903 /DNA_START=182 /DNA_END=2398 /DNA_ORIENTATION=+
MNSVIRLAGQRCNSLRTDQNCDDVCKPPLEDMYSLLDECPTTGLSDEMQAVLNIILIRFPPNYCDTLDGFAQECPKPNLPDPSNNCNASTIDLLGSCMYSDCWNSEEAVGGCPSECRPRLADFYSALADCPHVLLSTDIELLSSFTRAIPRDRCGGECAPTSSFSCTSECTMDKMSAAADDMRGKCGSTVHTTFIEPDLTAVHTDFYQNRPNSTCSEECATAHAYYYQLIDACVLSLDRSGVDLFGVEGVDVRQTIRDFPSTLCGAEVCQDISLYSNTYRNFDGAFCQCANKDMIEYQLYRVNQVCPSQMPVILSDGSLTPSDTMMGNNSSEPVVPQSDQCGSDCQLEFARFLKEFVKCFGILAEQYPVDTELIRYAIEEPCYHMDAVEKCDVALRGALAQMELDCSSATPGACDQPCTDAFYGASLQLDACRTLREDPTYGEEYADQIASAGTYCLTCQIDIETQKTTALETCSLATVFENVNHTLESCTAICSEQIASLREAMLACENPNMGSEADSGSSEELSERNSVFLDGLAQVCTTTSSTQLTCLDNLVRETQKAVHACVGGVCSVFCQMTSATAYNAILGCPVLVTEATSTVDALQQMCAHPDSFMIDMKINVGGQNLVEDALVDQVRAAGIIETERLQVLFFRSPSSKKRITGESEALLEISVAGQAIEGNTLSVISDRLLNPSAFANTGLDGATTVVVVGGSVDASSSLIASTSTLVVVLIAACFAMFM